ncbi:hypothetical protein CVT24_010333 [Panaeolus cyanescens]|uniref:Cytochrome P450 n=1 Tax=Panaeolus cyanescens TaxID=181874 RepID=A0A409YQE4_9AGAR|nr:hypothetical protein CVT24_010333 [Panaeolus cyanescens]
MLQLIQSKALDLLTPQYLAIGAATTIYWACLAYYQGQSRKLRHVPSIGTTIPLLTYGTAIRYLVNGWKVVAEGLSTWNGQLFKVPDLLQWIVVAADRTSIDDIRKAPENVLSAMEAINEASLSLQVDYTLGENIHHDPYHIPIIRAQLTRSLPILVPEVHDELSHAFNDHIPPSEDWVAFPALDTMMQVIARASNRVFVGLPLCRNPEFLKLGIDFTMQVVKAGAILRMLPKFIRPLANRILSSVDSTNRAALGHLEPIIEDRRKKRAEMGKDYPGKPVDLLTWFMDEAKGEETSSWALTSRILTLNFAAIHTSSMVCPDVFILVFKLSILTSMPFRLLRMFSITSLHYPEYTKLIREEVEEVTGRLGWTKDAIDEMYKVDSFIKETQRLHPLATILMSRVAVNDYTFSNGTTVPKGTTVAVSVTSTHFDEQVFANALTFDPLRFFKLREHAESKDGGRKFDFVNTGLDALGFGHGRHACPGRYFASSELKLMLALIATTYDVKTEVDGVRPPDLSLPLSYIVGAGLVSIGCWVILSYMWSQARRLKSITTVGSSLPLLSHLQAIRFFVSAGSMVDEGIRKGSGRLFKVPDFLKWIVIAGDRRSSEDIWKAPEHVLSATQAMVELIQTQYAFGLQIIHDPYHIPIIRTAMPRALPRLMIDVHDEIVHACNDHLPSTTDWTPLSINDTAMAIVARATNRVFVGKQLCRNPVYLKINVRFATDVVSTAFFLKFVPKFLRPTVNRLISNVPHCRKVNFECLDPIINERRRQQQEHPSKGDEKPSDILAMLMEEAKGEEATNARLSDRLIMINFAAIHTTSTSFGQALLCLAEHPQCVKMLRAEAEDVVSRHGWTKDAIDEMTYIDGFLKETQRLHPVENITMLRTAMEDYTFSDGTTIPKGTTVAVPMMPRHLNSSVYQDPHIFVPLRFVKLKAKEAEAQKAKKYDLITTSTDHIAFGHGRHACPGRFFAAAELKLLMAYFVLHYDIRLEQEGVRPKDLSIYTARLVRPSAKALFRRREVKTTHH